MKSLTEEKFLRWAKKHGLGLDPRYPQSAVLTFREPGDARFWCVPPKPERRPYFLRSLIELMGDWRACFTWRHLGSWPDANRIDPVRINDVVEHQILKGLGLPVGTANVVEFDRSESAALVTLLFSTTVFGWSVGEDLYVVPDHASCFLQTSHHDVVHAVVRDSGDLERWTAEMGERGFALPEELPDPTFKRPAWMPKMRGR